MKFRLFKYIIMPFGLINALVAFQRINNYVLWEYLNDFIVYYLDNILIFLEIEEEYMEYIYKVLKAL